MRPRRALYLYYRLMLQHLKSILEYQGDFWILMGAAVLTQVLGFVFLWVIFQRIPTISGWSFWEVAFIYAMIFFTEGVATFFFEGTWGISTLVHRAELDRYLVRPMSPLLQVLGSRIGMNGLGNMLIGVLIITQSLRNLAVEWSAAKIAMLLLLLVSAAAIRVAVNLAACSISFWTRGPGNAFPFFIHSISDFAKYPITIYALGIQVLVAVVVPYAFISVFPAAYLFGKGQLAPWGLLSPLVALYCLAVAVAVFYRGLATYESSGN